MLFSIDHFFLNSNICNIKIIVCEQNPDIENSIDSTPLIEKSQMNDPSKVGKNAISRCNYYIS